MGIEPTLSAWKAEVLPLNYTRTHLSLFLLGIFLAPLKNYNKNITAWQIYTQACISGGGGRIRTFEGEAVRFTV